MLVVGPQFANFVLVCAERLRGKRPHLLPRALFGFSFPHTGSPKWCVCFGAVTYKRLVVGHYTVRLAAGLGVVVDFSDGGDSGVGGT